jgi:hypothetical protein
MTDIHATKSDIYHRARLTHYPDGSVYIMVSDRAIFREPGWEDARRVIPKEDPDAPYKKLEANDPERYMAVIEDEGFQIESSEYLHRVEARRAENRARAERRARNAVRDLALSNDFRFFVTLTLDRSKIDRYDIKAIMKRLRTWADNAVRRRGLKYILVPELHKDGAIHFHGFFNDALPAVDSGTLSNGGKPRKPRGDAERRRLLAEGWHVVYNLPAWTLGFTTAIELYGERRQAVAYVLKYISKAADTTGKIGGRWYYSGGDLQRPIVTYDDVSADDVAIMPGAFSGTVESLGCNIVIATTKGEKKDGSCAG